MYFACGHADVSYGAHGTDRLDPLELESQTVADCLSGVLGTERKSSGRAASALQSGGSSPSPLSSALRVPAQGLLSWTSQGQSHPWSNRCPSAGAGPEHFDHTHVKYRH